MHNERCVVAVVLIRVGTFVINMPITCQGQANAMYIPALVRGVGVRFAIYSAAVLCRSTLRGCIYNIIIYM